MVDFNRRVTPGIQANPLIAADAAAVRKRREEEAARQRQFEENQAQAAAAGQDLGQQGGPADVTDAQGKQVEDAYATKAETDKLFDPNKVSRQQNAASARGALAKLLQNQQDSPEARAANAANLKSKAAQATLAQKAQVGARGLTASGVGTSQVAAQERLGGRAQSQGMAAYDMDRRKEEQARKSTAIGLVPGIQRNELEAEAFLRAQAELNQLDREQEAGIGNIVNSPVGRVTIVDKPPKNGKMTPGSTFYVQNKEFRVYTDKDGKNPVAVQV